MAKAILGRIYVSTGQLTDHPLSGQIEPLLEHLGSGHRYLVSGNYKIIYRPVAEGILITDVFDTRQNPVKITRTSRTK